MLRIKNVEHIGDYKLKLLFSDEKTKVVDFEDWVKEESVYLRPLKDIQYFKKVKMDNFHYTICWPNGADFSPDVLYEMGKELAVHTKKTSTRRTPKRQRKTAAT